MNIAFTFRVKMLGPGAKMLSCSSLGWPNNNNNHNNNPAL